MPPYNVKIDVFEGPFDLLLHLVNHSGKDAMSRAGVPVMYHTLKSLSAGSYQAPPLNGAANHPQLLFSQGLSGFTISC